jgi:amino acid transporter
LNIVCTTVEAGGLLFIIAVGARHWGDANLLTGPVDPVTGDFRALSIGVVLGGAVLTFFSFIGFEDILNVSEECKKPQTTVPIGLVGAMLIATVMYMLVAITAVSVLPDGQLAGKRLTDVAAKAAPWFPPALFSLITIFAVANTALLNCVMGSRLLYGMARQGLLPRPLAHVHRGRQTPWVAVAVMVAIVVTLMLIGQLDDLANATVLLLLTVFSIVNVGLIIVKLRPSEPRGSFEVPLFVPALGAVVCLILLATRLVRRDAQGHWDWEAPAIAAGLVALILVLYATLRPKNVIYDEEPAAG